MLPQKGFPTIGNLELLIMQLLNFALYFFIALVTDQKKNLAHYRALQSLPLILGDKYKSDADYLDTCRKKRNETEYEFAGNVSEDEVIELLDFCKELKSAVLTWLKKNGKGS